MACAVFTKPHGAIIWWARCSWEPRCPLCCLLNAGLTGYNTTSCWGVNINSMAAHYGCETGAKLVGAGVNNLAMLKQGR